METLSTVMTFAWGQFGQAVEWATANPIVIVPVGFGIVGAAIGCFKKAIRVGGRRR